MSRMEKRIEALEGRAEPTKLAPHLKAWLGIELTPAEQAEADRLLIDADFDDVDWSEFSEEVREWLQQD